MDARGRWDELAGRRRELDRELDALAPQLLTETAAAFFASAMAAEIDAQQITVSVSGDRWADALDAVAVDGRSIERWDDLHRDVRLEPLSDLVQALDRVGRERLCTIVGLSDGTEQSRTLTLTRDGLDVT